MPNTSKWIKNIYHYRYDQKLGLGIVAIRRIRYGCHASTVILSLYWYPKIKKGYNKPTYGRVYNWKYSQIIGCHNNWILMKF